MTEEKKVQTKSLAHGEAVINEETTFSFFMKKTAGK